MNKPKRTPAEAKVERAFDALVAACPTLAGAPDEVAAYTLAVYSHGAAAAREGMASALTRLLMTLRERGLVTGTPREIGDALQRAMSGGVS